MAIFLVFYILAVIAFHIFGLRKMPRSTAAAKIVPGVMFIALAMHYAKMQPYDICIAAGLILGTLGDLLLALRKIWPAKKLTFIAAGMAAFALGHVGYIGGLFQHIEILHAAAAAAAGLAVGAVYIFIAPKLNLVFGKLKKFIYIYTSIIFTMVCAAVLRWIAMPSDAACIFGIAAVLFAVSDSLLSMDYFDKDRSKSTPAVFIGVHVTYYAAQLMIAWSLSL